MNRFIIGDVHGCIKTLEALVKQLPNKAQITFVGDLIDRGTNSYEVVEFVKSNGYDCVLGNHELYMLETMPLILDGEINPQLDLWYSSYGGKEAIQSYNNDESKILKHLEWFDTLPLFATYDLSNTDGKKLLVSHSSIGKYDMQNPDKRYNNKKFIKQVTQSRTQHITNNQNIFNIFGHTPIPSPIIKEYYANIDTGCVYTNMDFGYLSALEFPSMRVFTQKNID